MGGAPGTRGKSCASCLAKGAAASGSYCSQEKVCFGYAEHVVCAEEQVTVANRCTTPSNGFMVTF